MSGHGRHIQRLNLAIKLASSVKVNMLPGQCRNPLQILQRFHISLFFKHFNHLEEQHRVVMNHRNGDQSGRFELRYENRRKLVLHLSEMTTYIGNNSHLIPNYGEKYLYGETITTAFSESTVNEAVAKRMVKKQQMQWSRQGAHCLLQARTAVLNGELRDHFVEWYPEMHAGGSEPHYVEPVKLAA